MQKLKYTSRKFYNKYLYKASLNMPGIGIYRMKSLEETVELLESPLPKYRGMISDTINKAYKNKDHIIALSNFIMALQGDYCKRIERDTIDFYTNDHEVHDKICKRFYDVLRVSFIPNQNHISELDSNKYIICKKLPHNKYKFKVFLLPHKLKNSKEEKVKYVAWLAKQNSVRISPTTELWFINTDWYWDRRYMYVADEHTLLMVQMRNPNVLGRVYEYLVSDK